MDENLMNTIIPDLALLLIFLTGWEEDNRRAVKDEKKKKVFRSWKGYRYEILKELQSRGLILQVPGGKSLYLTEKGKQQAEELKQKYLKTD